MKVIEGSFGKEPPVPEEAPKSFQDIVNLTEMADCVPESCVILIETGGHIHTYTYPNLNILELIGVLDFHKYLMQTVAVQGGGIVDGISD